MKIPSKKNFIEVLTFLQSHCEEPKNRVCIDCIFHGDIDCLLSIWPEYWDIDQIVECLYGREV